MSVVTSDFIKKTKRYLCKSLLQRHLLLPTPKSIVCTTISSSCLILKLHQQYFRRLQISNSVHLLYINKISAPVYNCWVKSWFKSLFANNWKLDTHKIKSYCLILKSM